MPDQNPFFSSDAEENKANINRAAREKLFADLGLTPVTKEDYVDVFGDSPEIKEPASVEPDFINTNAEKPTDAEAEAVVDAIFAATETEPATEELSFEEPVEAVPAASTSQVSSESSSSLFAEDAEAEQSASSDMLTSADASDTASSQTLAEGQFASIVTAYQDLQQKLTANQALISAERESIAELRNHMRKLNALGHEFAENNDGLTQGRQLVQTDSCATLIRSINQVNEMIQQNGQQAAELLSPIKTGVEVLELRVKHVNAIENLLTHMREGMDLQKKLTQATHLVQELGQFLGVKAH